MSLMDYEGIVRLCDHGFSFQEAMDLLEDDQNQICFNSIRKRLLTGEEINSFIGQYIPKQYKRHLLGFLRLLPLTTALSLSLKIENESKNTKKQIQSELTYPILLFLGTLIGMFLFMQYCFPALTEVAEDFNTDITPLHRISISVTVLHLFLMILMLMVLSLFYWLRNDDHQIAFYRHIFQIRSNSIYIKYHSLELVRFYQYGLIKHLSTNDTFLTLSTLKDLPIIAYLAHEIGSALNEGNALVDSMRSIELDPMFHRYLKISLYTSHPEEVLDGYIEQAQSQLNNHLKYLSRLLQFFAYALIAFLVLLIYQVLLLPMTMMSSF